MYYLRIWLVSVVSVLSLSAADEWAMRWRVYTDTVGGISFRYPYEYYTHDQYKGELFRRQRLKESDDADSATQVIEIEGKKYTIHNSGEGAPVSGPDVRAFSLSAKELAELNGGSELDGIGNAIAKQKFIWQTYDYYKESAARAFASKKIAMKDISAKIGENERACAIIVKHGERYSGLIMTGKLKAAENQAIIDGFEILLPGKPKVQALNWRESQTRTVKAFDQAGKLVAVAGGVAKPVPWGQGWDVETAHYHITSHVSPARLLQHAQYLEALYKGFTGIYVPDAVPPYKFEIHIFNTQKDFMSAAAAHGFPVSQGVGGFFVPSLQSIFVYEESNKWGGEDFSVEHVMAHECSHQFLHMTCNGSQHVPTWINEGLAVYFEAGIVQNGQFVERMPKERIAYLKQIYDQTKKTIFPVDRYLSHYDHILAEQYGEVYAMTNFWLFGTCEAGCKHKAGQCGRAHFRDYWQRLKNGEDGTKSFDATFMDGLIKAKGTREAAISAWQQAYFNYVKTNLR